MSKLKFIALSGTTGVTENLYIYEYGNDMIIVDCGIGFPGADMYGVDLVLPDFEYIKKNRNKLKGIFITHGHEDHLGALPFLLKEIKVPVYASKLTAGFIKDKLEDRKVHGVSVKSIDPEKDTVAAGAFRVTPFRITHSVPDAVGFVIDTPEGKLVHAADYKFDWTPVDGKPFDIAKLAMLTSGGVLAMASDSLGSTNTGATKTELEIESRVERIVRGSKNRVFFSTISSNISRMQQAINVAVKTGRKISFVGRSVERKAEIAKKLGYLKYPFGIVVDQKKARNIKRPDIMYIISGSYGQEGSALHNAAIGEHRFVKAEAGDTVIFSGDPAPPGSKANVDSIVDMLITSNIEVHYYDMQEDLHVSGHGSQEDIKTLVSIVGAKYMMPIGGTVRHNRAFNELAQGMGYKKENIYELSPGEVLEFSHGTAKKAKKIEVREVLVDGLGVGDVGNTILRDRKVLAKDGVAVILMKFDRAQGKLINKPEVISRGFVFEAQEKGFLEFASKELTERLKKEKRLDKNIIKNASVNFLERFFFKKTGRRPMIVPVVVEI